MKTISDSHDSAIDDYLDLRELGERLEAYASQLAARSQVPSPDAIELHCRSTVLHRAAFVLRSELASADIELRDHAT